MSSEQQPEPAERRWWHGYFVRAGRLGGLRKVKKDTARVRLPCCRSFCNSSGIKPACCSVCWCSFIWACSYMQAHMCQCWPD